jgi:glutamate N-acetyltransferase/amino-acid N-acetyltransferase
MKLSTKKSPAVPGFTAAGLACGIKDGTLLDLALIVSETPAKAAGVFTRNRVRSPSVTWCEKALKKTRDVKAVLINSGNANACVGPQGYADCKNIAGKLAEELSVSPQEILFASTGIIGVPLPAEKITSAISLIAKKRSSKNWNKAADAILTTDLVRKTAVLEYKQSGKTIVIGGITKGSGMIHPNMATMLGFVQTNANVETGALQKALKEATDRSFNCITVDGDMSTNDCLILLANGVARNPLIRYGTKAYKEFVAALTELSISLAKQIVLDGEGATKFVTVRVEGAKSRKQAHTIANSVATSSLVKTALFGEDPNWGRILAAVGYAGVPIKPDQITIALNGGRLFQNGTPLKAANQDALRKKMQKKNILLNIHLGEGKEWAELYTCDFSYDYVRINAEYTT